MKGARTTLPGLFKILTGVLLIGMAACSNENTNEVMEQDLTAQEDDDLIQIGLLSDMVTFDPQDNGSFGTPILNVFDTLVRIDDEGEIYPHLAQDYELIDDLTWHFTLHEDVMFHHGEELTAEDVKFTLERVASDASLVEHSRFDTIEDVNIIDDYNFEIVTNEPDPALLNRLIRMGGGIIPKDYFEEHGAEQFNQRPVGSGPYEVVDYQPGNHFEMERFEDYFQGDVSDWDRALFRILPEDATRVNELLTGGVDVIDDVPPAEWSRVNDNQRTDIIPADSTQVMLLIANGNDGFPTSDVRVRQAIDYAIDSEAIVQTLFQGYGTPSRTHMTPGVEGLNEELYDTSHYDLEKAKQLLEEAGYGEDQPLQLNLQIPQGRYLMDSDLGQLVAGMLEQVGIQVEIEMLEDSNFVDVRNNNNNDSLMLAGYGNSMFDPFLPLDALHSETFPERIGYQNERVDELLDTANSTLDHEERMNYFIEAQEILAEDLPYIYIYNEQYFTGINSEQVSYDPPPNKDILLEDIVKE